MALPPITDSHPTTELAPGAEIAGCRIEGVAGRGGMGVVYRATQLDLGRPVAIKVIAADRARDPGLRTRFSLEARLAAAIDHPNLVPVHAAGEEDGRLYLVMRYVQGTDLHRCLKQDGPLAPARAARVVSQVAAGLDAAHTAGLVHRDVKPANVLVASEHVYLGDFGLSRLQSASERITESGAWIGTVDYMSPEHLRGEPTDARSDVYALGCVLYAALTGEPPFRRGTVPQTMSAHLHQPPPRPTDHAPVPAAFDRVIERALAKRPEDRYPSAGDLGRAALAAARGEPVTESERSVAVGPAAPDEAETVVNGGRTRRASAAAAADATAITRWDPATAEDDATAVTSWDHAAHDDGVRRDPPDTDDDPRRLWASPGADEPPPPEDLQVSRPRRWPYQLAAGVMIFAALVAVGLIAGQVFDGPGGAASRTGPLSENEVRDAAEAFADAYASEDPSALRQTLARDVTRTLPGGTSKGREQVVDQYTRQFDGKVRGYDLNDLTVTGGRAGRASGTYRVDRDGGDPYEGTIVFGVVRERGQPRIKLIAAQPKS
jgi:hypothetical protein